MVARDELDLEAPPPTKKKRGRPPKVKVAAWGASAPPRTLPELLDFSAGMLDATRRRELEPDEARAIGALIKAHRELLELERLHSAPAKDEGDGGEPIPDELLERVSKILEQTAPRG